MFRRILILLGDAPCVGSLMHLLEFTPEIERQTRSLYDRVARVIPREEWPVHAPYVAAINALKRRRKALIFAHNYQTPEIFHCVADVVGDSLGLARAAARADAEIIVLCGVHFMAETAKLLAPEKMVLIPDARAGCSLAKSICASDVRALRQRYPDAAAVAYVNTTAAVKAEVDACCTSSNAVRVVESMGTKRVIFVPDGYLARYVASQTDVQLVWWEGRCDVHARFSDVDIRDLREGYPGISVLAHPECAPGVLAQADFVGSTSAMVRFLGEQRPAQAVLITECSMSDNVSANHPEIDFVRPCNLCQYMKRISLPKIYRSLLTLRHEVEIPPSVARRARAAVERMIAIAD